jgi:hypothetical protein
MHEQNPATDNSYALSHAPAETRRLQVQAQILNPSTQQLLQQAGVGVETVLQNGVSRSLPRSRRHGRDEATGRAGAKRGTQ